jgi:hypothetical protein
MNRFNKSFLFGLFLFFATNSFSPKAIAQFSMNFQIFYDELSPYGEWVNNPNYGYVWVPDVSNGFAPYGTNGYWVYTDAGWTWMSYYDWGWAPFHYGRWYNDPYYGYAWIPGDEWGPGWVIWRRSSGYYGWAPIGPGISIDIAYSGFYNQPFNQWRFVRNRDFGRTNIYNYYTNVSNYTTIINNSTVINNMYEQGSQNVRYNTGPARAEVQQKTGNAFKPVALTKSERPGQALRRNELQIYKPKIERADNNVAKPAPERITDWNNGKPEVRRDAAIRKQNKNQPANKKPELPNRTDQPVSQQPTQRPTQPQRNKPDIKDNPVKVPVQQPQRNELPQKQKPIQQPPQRVEPVKEKPIQEPAPPQPQREPKQQPVPPAKKEVPQEKPVEQPKPQSKKQPATEQPQAPPIPPAKKQTGKGKAGIT